MHRVLKQALAQAVLWQELVRNPADGVKPPKAERKQMQALDVDATGVRYKAPKSDRGRRTVALSAAVVAELRAHRIAQAQELLKLGVRLSRRRLRVDQA
jgi:hypothetical protein